MNHPTHLDARYAGLREVQAGLPARFYYDPARYDLELAAIWRREWFYLCRETELPDPLCFQVFDVLGQSVLLLRDEGGALRAFHNTCRHRGAELCQAREGRLKSKLLVCPYHQWAYALDGRLVRTPHVGETAGFRRADYPLYEIALQRWRGFVFASLAADPPPFEAAFDPGPATLANWPLERLVVGHTFRKELACNWKLFWENYNECLHCPGIHPELCDLVPLYDRAIMGPQDAPDWRAHLDNSDPRYAGGLRAGAETWSADGRAAPLGFPGLTAEERGAGHTFVTLLPTAFIVAHVDYVRIVRLLPLAPERTELLAQWLFLPEALAEPGFDLDNIVRFAVTVMSQDGAACELNQRGLKAAPHERGVLVAQEYELARLHAWIEARLDHNRNTGSETA